jgi:hypothetical protein
MLIDTFFTVLKVGDGWMHLTVKTAAVRTAVFMFWNFKVHFIPSCQPC